MKNIKLLTITPVRLFSTSSCYLNINKHEKEPSMLEFASKTKPIHAFGTYDPKNVESDWYDWWEKIGVFKPSQNK
eukprot:Pgem_evm1s5440